MAQVDTARRPLVAGATTLQLAATFFAAAVVVHGADHLRRGGDSLNADVFWLGTAAIALEVGVVALVFMRHPVAPLAAAVVGFSLAVGYFAVHFTPERGWLSDSFPSSNAAVASWVAGSLETAAALALGVAGLAAWRFDRSVGDAAAAAPSAGRAGWRHPVVVAMALANLVILAGSLAAR